MFSQEFEKESIEFTFHLGVVSTNDDGVSHKVMLDADTVRLSYLMGCCYEAVERFNLPPIYIILSSVGRYQALCFSELSWNRLLRVMRWFVSKNIVSQFWYDIRKKRDYFALRLDYKYRVEQPRIIQCIPSPHPENLKEKQEYHAMLQNMKKINDAELKRFTLELKAMIAYAEANNIQYYSLENLYDILNPKPQSREKSK